MVTEKRYLAYCRECEGPLNGELDVFHNSDGTWSFELTSMSCERTKYLYEVYKEEFGLGENREVDEKQDEAFDDMISEHMSSWIMMETLHVEGATYPRV